MGKTKVYVQFPNSYALQYWTKAPVETNFELYMNKLQSWKIHYNNKVYVPKAGRFKIESGVGTVIFVIEMEEVK